MDLVYLDNNATTRPDPAVVQAMLAVLEQWYANPSSVHRFGQRVRHAIDEARAQVAGLIHAAPNQVTFTSGGTEAINTAIRSLLQSRAPRRKLVTSTVEHSATRELCAQLAREGVEIVEVPVSIGGELDLDFLAAHLSDEVALVSIMWANNETGVIFPVGRIGQMCREYKVPFHCDAVQAAGKVPVDVAEVQVDVLSLAAHKFHGPKGVGALYVRRGIRLRPLVIGGPQETNRRGGTENVPGIVGMGVAAELAGANLPKMVAVAALRDRLEAGILSAVPETSVNGRTDLRVGNTTNISFAGLEAEAILMLLSEQGVCASAGAACSSGSLEPSHVLRAMGIPDRIAHGAIRFSLSRFSTDEETDRALQIVPPAIARLRAVMPVG